MTTRCFSTSALPRQNQHGPRGAGGRCSPLSLACLLGFGSNPLPSSPSPPNLLTSWWPLLSSCFCFLFFPAARALGSKKKFCSERSPWSPEAYGGNISSYFLSGLKDCLKWKKLQFSLSFSSLVLRNYERLNSGQHLLDKMGSKLRLCGFLLV